MTIKSKVFKVFTAPCAFALGAALFIPAFIPTLSAAEAEQVSASERKGRFTATKECSTYTGLAGQFCTMTSSNVGAILAGSKVFYTLAAGVPPGVLDTDVVLDAGGGNRAVGHCTLDLSTGLGLCAFSDGTGQFAGFEARVNVSYEGGPNWRWEGTYSFTRKHLKADSDR